MPLNVKLALSSNSPPAPAITIRLSVKSSTLNVFAWPPALISTTPANVAPEDTLTSSKVVSPITSKWLLTVAPPEWVVAPAKVVTPAIFKLSKFVWPSTSKSAFRSILFRNVDIPPWTPTSKFLSTVRSRYENVEIPDVGAPVCPIYL